MSDTTRGIYIDGTHYNVPIESLKRTGEFLDKYANRTEDGVLHRELIGVYYNYQIEFGEIRNEDTYDAVYDVLSEPVESHTLMIPAKSGWYTFEAYISSLSDELKKITSSSVEYDALKCEFIAMEPARTP